MHTDKNLDKLSLGEAVDPEDSNREKSLRWLLDMDLSEPEEKLFTVAGNDYLDTGLSAYEAEVAGRPLVRGNAKSDDLATYVDEEIVISSVGEAGDIYNRKDVPAEEESAVAARQEVMAIDFSRQRDDTGIASAATVAEGADILGLEGDDDIGEKFVSIKRIKPVVDKGAARPVGNAQDVVDDTAQGSAPGDLQAEAAQAEPPVAAVSVMSSIQRAEMKLAAELAEKARNGEVDGVSAPAPISDSSQGTVVADGGDSDDVIEYPSVREYVATLPASMDDEEFDSYLLGGEHLPDGSSDPEELVVQRVEGVISVDPSTDVQIDYHEDFRVMEGSGHSPVAAVATMIPQVVEEILSAVRERLRELECDDDAVIVDVTLGADEAAIQMCTGQGYEPVSEVCFQLPASLLAVDEATLDVVYVRLLNAQHKTNWNRLFGFHFVPFQDPVEHSPATLSEEVAAIPAPAGPTTVPGIEVTDWAQDEGFGEDIFGEDFAQEFSAPLSTDGDLLAADIEAVFADLSQFEDSPDEICGVGFDAFGTDSAGEQAAAPLQADAAVEPALVEVEAAPPVVMESAASLDPVEEVDPAAFDGTCLDGFIPDYITFNFTSQSNAEIFTDFLDAFIEEGTVEVEKLESEVGEWEKQVANEALFAKVSRTLHTIKGIAKGVGLQRLGTLVHNFETLLDKMPRPAAGGEQTYFRIVNAWLDAVVRGVAHVTDRRTDVASELPHQGGEDARNRQLPGAESASAGVVEAQRTEVPGVQAAQQPAPASALEKRRDQQLADEGAKVLAAQQSVRITSEKLDHLLNLASQAQQLGVRASQNTSRSKRSSAELQARLSSVRTHIRKIADRALLDVNARPGSSAPDMDALEMDQYSELQEAASILREGVEDLADLVDVVSRQNMQIETLLKQQSSVISGISSSIQSARVVPVSRLMPGLRRIVRTVSTDLGKIVSFKVLNETGALDRDHYARLQVVLEHMVRNALDHGIESPDERVAMGKPTGGRITIDVRKSGADYLVRLADDGRGIDPDAIRESAYEKGLDVDVDALSDDEAIRLIFHKGFSTASTLSEISGRGVGMDIVLNELQQIGGDVQIKSTVGLGTAFEVRIPSNVSVNGALLVAAAGESYAIPLNGLVAVEQIPAEEFFGAVEGNETLLIGDMVCEPTYLATLCQGVGLPGRRAWEKFVPVIIAGSPERFMAIAIDNLEEALELVVRSLGSQFSSVPGVAGAATTAEGAAIVALDLNLLVSNADADGIVAVAVNQAKPTTLLALVVDDSRTQRMVATSQLDTVGVETVTAENGLVAIDLLNATHRLPDIILLDVEMPVKDGIQTLREIRKSRRYGHLPVIMVTSRTGAKHRALAGEAGCSAYMGKPFNFPELIKQINALTGYDLQLS